MPVSYLLHSFVSAGTSKEIPLVLTAFFHDPVFLIMYLHFMIVMKIGPHMLARIAKKTGLSPNDL